MPVDRRTAIADAIIATLAGAGSRGLTHRAVDRAAGLPAGSTSYYLRSRSSLFVAAVERLAELDAAEVPPLGEDLVPGLGTTVVRMLADGRERQLARYELTLESVRRSELREALVAGSARVREVVAEQLRKADLPDPDGRARDVMAMLDGLLLAELTGTHGPPRSERELCEALALVVGPDRSSGRAVVPGSSVAERGS